MKRICVKCGDLLGDQQRHHFSSKKQYTGSGNNKWMYRCYGPGSTPGGRTRRSSTSLPVHYQERGNYRATACGLKPGRVAGRYRDREAQVPWTRVRSEAETTTCPECLAIMVVSLDARLTTVLRQTAGPGRIKEALKGALERARTRITMNGVERLVSNG